jgi:hypothetical protein
LFEIFRGEAVLACFALHATHDTWPNLRNGVLRPDDHGL